MNPKDLDMLEYKTLHLLRVFEKTRTDLEGLQQKKAALIQENQRLQTLQSQVLQKIKTIISQLKTHEAVHEP